MDRYIAREATGEKSMSARVNNPNNLKVESIAEILKKIVYLYTDNWYWFLLAIFLAFVYTWYQVKSTEPVYERKVSILIRSKQDGDEKLIRDLGLTPTNTNMINEMEMLKTSRIAEEIVNRLDLNIEYVVPGRFHDNVLYFKDSPLNVTFLDVTGNTYGSFDIGNVKGKGFTLSNFIVNDEMSPSILKGILNDTIESPLGRIVVTANENIEISDDLQLTVRHNLVSSTIRNTQRGIITTLRDPNSTIIDISYQDVSPSRAEDVLNTLVGVYNENWLRDRNLKTVNTDKFIKERLAVIESELGDVEQSISSWKSENLMLDVNATGSFAQSQVNEAEASLQELSTQEYMTRYIRDYLTDGRHNDQLLPANSGITNASIEALIKQYNEAMLQRNNHLANSSRSNPVVQDLEENLEALRGSILQSLDYELVMLKSKESHLKGQRSQAISKVAINPTKARQLLSVERQQKVKEELYLYLLERREENELSQAFDVYNNQFIESPFGLPDPIRPQRRLILTASLMIALIIPTFILGAREYFNTRITGKKDLEGLSVPYAGDIPRAHRSKKHRFLFRKDKSDHPEILVKEHNRNILNEAFRVIRTNLEFMLGFGQTHKVVMVTSLTPGSGKTFITANLSTALALRDKKVIALDLDLRKATLSKYVGSPRHGISNYISGQEEDYHNLIVKLGKLDILPCGTLPPNPAELLFSPRFKEMIESLKEEYDYVFLDCAPVEIVADTTVISMYADLTLFIVRVRNLYHDMLPDIEQWYHDKKYGNLAIILNGIERSHGKYGYHRYGYHYGSYGYGYRYGSKGYHSK